LIGIIRGIQEKDLVGTIEAAIAGGLTTIEITMNTPDSSLLIKKASDFFSDRAIIGAGTVITKEDLNSALEAGASFIVAPNFNVEIAGLCSINKTPYFPGALTPTEIINAWNAGVTMVKVFPVSSMGGARYIQELRGPYASVKLLACGGVTPENINEYFSAGIDCIAIGSQIFNREWMENKQFDKIQRAAELFVQQVKVTLN